jgi:hypothetical protein
MRRTSCAIALGLLLWCALAGPACADGGLFFTSVAGGSSGDQRAIILFNGSRESLVLQTAARDAQTPYAWVIPTPGPVDSGTLAEIPDTVFSQTDSLTAPVLRDDTTGGSLGCGCGMSAAGGGDSTTPTVTVWGVTQVGDYEVTQLTATDQADLSMWLAGHGYVLPAATGPILSRYITQGWAFTAIRVTALPQGDTDLALNPLALTFDTTQAVFPLVISQVSATGGEDCGVLLYVLASDHVEATPYPTIALDTSTLYGWSPLSAYADRLRAQSRQGGPAFVVEYSRFVSRDSLPESLRSLPGCPNTAGTETGATGAHVTRLRSYFLGSEMVEDVAFTAAPEKEPAFRETLWNGVAVLHYGGLSAPQTAARLSPALAIGICVGLSTRSRACRRLAWGAMAMALAALVIL